MKNKLFLRILSVALCLISSSLAQAGTDIGNGGDLIRCVPYAGNDLNGLYSLDYLIFATQTGAKVSEAQSWEESILRVRRLFVDKLPELLPVFDDFVNNILNEDQSRRQVWEPTDYELTELSDEELPASVKIPVNCRDNGKLQLVQAVIRQNPTFTGSKLIVYKYMPKMFEKMAKERPLQLSFLLVHEFLWSISDNVDRNRRINWFLHSEEIQSLSRLQVIDRLLGMGLNVKEVPRILDSKGRGHFTTLQDALAQAREGETIVVKEGVYSASGISIINPIHLIGEGDRTKIIIKGTATSPALDFALEKDQTATVENVTIQRMVEPIEPGPSGDVIVISSGTLKMKDVSLDTNIRSGDDRCILRVNQEQNLLIDNATFGSIAVAVCIEKNFRGSLSIKNSYFKGLYIVIEFRASASDYANESFKPKELKFENNRFEEECPLFFRRGIYILNRYGLSQAEERVEWFLKTYKSSFFNNQYPVLTPRGKGKSCRP